MYIFFGKFCMLTFWQHLGGKTILRITEAIYIGLGLGNFIFLYVDR